MCKYISHMIGRRGILALIILLEAFVPCNANSYDDVGYWEAQNGSFAPLSLDYYKDTCPRVAHLIRTFTRKAVHFDRSFAAAVLRLHFHDCFVHGCDGSVLIDSPPYATNATLAEKDSKTNARSLRGFEKISELKSILEYHCPGVVSCADILALSARDAVVKVGGKSWVVPLGRKDGLVSCAKEAEIQLPGPLDDYDKLVQNFAYHNLSAKDMVVLSGSHTIGIAHCAAILPRLYNSTQPGAMNGTDADLNPTFATKLKKFCPPVGSRGNLLAMDPSRGNNTFDKNYFKLVLAQEVDFRSDSTLISNPYGAAIVAEQAGHNSPFQRDFGWSMIKMGLLPIPPGDPSNIRLDCAHFN